MRRLAVQECAAAMAAPAAACAWAPAGGSGPAPQPRSGHTFTTCGDTHVLFGGTVHGAGGKAAFLSDAWIAQVQADGAVAWQPLAAEGPAPAPRARHSAVPLDSRRVLIWGGLDHKARFNDLWVLDIPTKRWQEVHAQGAPPPARAHHSGGCWGLEGGHAWAPLRCGASREPPGRLQVALLLLFGPTAHPTADLLPAATKLADRVVIFGGEHVRPFWLRLLPVH